MWAMGGLGHGPLFEEWCPFTATVSGPDGGKQQCSSDISAGLVNLHSVILNVIYHWL